MFAPMTPQNDYARFEAETRERARRAEYLINAQLQPSTSLLNDLVRRFTEWALRRPQAKPDTTPEFASLQAPECC